MKKIHIIGIIIIAIAIASMFTLLANSTTYENFNDAKAKAGQTVEVAGQLDRSKPMDYDPQKDPNKFSFYMKDNKGVESHVVLLQCKPQDFERSQEVVAVGHMQGDEFVAGSVLMKCPSKYNDGRTDLVSSSQPKTSN